MKPAGVPSFAVVILVVVVDTSVSVKVLVVVSTMVIVVVAVVEKVSVCWVTPEVCVLVTTIVLV